jgi:hypothetical protein
MRTPVANYAGQAIRYRNAASGLLPDTAADLDKAVAETRFFMPMLNGAQAPGAQAFDLQGRVIDPFALGSPAAGLFQTLGDKLVSATEAVQADKDGQPLLALHSFWLEFTHTAPSGATRSQRRYLVPPREDYSGDPQALTWPLITDHVYLLANGGQPLDLLADHYLHTAEQGMDWLRVMVHKTFEPDVGAPLPAELPAEFPPLVQYWLMDHDPGLKEGVIAYRAEPGLLGLRRGYEDAETAFVGVDIVWNTVEHLQTTSTGLTHVPRAALARGAWDTALESVPARARRLNPHTVASTIGVMNLAADQDVPTKVLVPKRTADLSALGLDAAGQFFLRRDLESGYAVVIPTRVPEGAGRGAWWRVHPETGETLGMTGDGYGQEMAEYITDMVLTYQSLVDAVGGLEKCKAKPTIDTKLCCLVEAHVNNVAGLSFGGILGATTGTAGAAVFDLTNRESGNALMPSAKAGCEKLPATAW